MSALALSAAASTRALAGRRPRWLDGRILFALLSVPFVLASAAWGPLELDGYYAALLAALGVFVCYFAQRGLRRSTERHNEAVRLLHQRRWDEAEAGFARVASGLHPRSHAVVALHNLAHLSLRRAAFGDAVTFLRASLEAERGLRDAAQNMLSSSAMLAYALACDGKLDEAEASLVALGEAHTANALVYTLCARAVLAYRRSRYDETLALLDRERTFLTNWCNAQNAALLAHLERACRAQASGAYRASAPEPPLLPVDALTQTFVDRVLGVARE